jgi:heme/copper-type cytochrome/quinol oxidase subunit 2
LAVGDARVDHRPSVAAGESSFVRLTIASAPSLSSLKTERVTPRAPNDPGFIYKLSPGIDLYPWMWAELQVAPGSFELSPPGRQRKPVIAGHAAEWVWALSPAQARGRQDLTIHIGTIVVPADSATELEVETTESIAIAIVVEPAAPTSTLPSAVTAARGDNIASILFVMLVIIGGVLALVVALIRQERAERGRTTG